MPFLIIIIVGTGPATDMFVDEGDGGCAAGLKVLSRLAGQAKLISVVLALVTRLGCMNTVVARRTSPHNRAIPYSCGRVSPRSSHSSPRCGVLSEGRRILMTECG